jgi:tetratricopeptide (TPR) repeat protein
MVGGDSTGAAEDFKKLARQYPGSPLASRALYAAGWIYENRLFDRDSAIATYTRLMALYPASQYAVRVASKIAEVNLKLKQAAAADTSAARGGVQNPGAGVPDSLRRRAIQTPVPGVPDSLQRRGQVFVPNPDSAASDSLETKRMRISAPRRGPVKEGPTPD